MTTVGVAFKYQETRAAINSAPKTPPTAPSVIPKVLVGEASWEARGGSDFGDVPTTGTGTRIQVNKGCKIISLAYV